MAHLFRTLVILAVVQVVNSQQATYLVVKEYMGVTDCTGSPTKTEVYEAESYFSGLATLTNAMTAGQTRRLGPVCMNVLGLQSIQHIANDGTCSQSVYMGSADCTGESKPLPFGDGSCKSVPDESGAETGSKSELCTTTIPAGMQLTDFEAMVAMSVAMMTGVAAPTTSPTPLPAGQTFAPATQTYMVTRKYTGSSCTGTPTSTEVNLFEAWLAVATDDDGNPIGGCMVADTMYAQVEASNGVCSAGMFADSACSTRLTTFPMPVDDCQDSDGKGIIRSCTSQIPEGTTLTEPIAPPRLVSGCSECLSGCISDSKCYMTHPETGLPITAAECGAEADPPGTYCDATPGATPSTPAPTAVPQVVMAMTVAGVSYDGLMADAVAKTAFETTIKATVAGTLAGSAVTMDHVTLVLSAGSVNVEATVTVPPEADVESVQNKLSQAQTGGGLATTLAFSLGLQPSIAAVATGAITIEVAPPIVATPAPTPAPEVSEARHASATPLIPQVLLAATVGWLA